MVTAKPLIRAVGVLIKIALLMSCRPLVVQESALKFNARRERGNLLLIDNKESL